MRNPFDLSGRTFLVTGASAGIGRACSVVLSEQGARVVLLARNSERLRQTAEQLRPGDHLALPFDLVNTDEIEETIATLCMQCGWLDGIVHCAGKQLVKPLRVLKTDHVAELMQINVTAGLMLVKAFRRPEHHSDHGAVVFIASVMGLVGEPARAAYSASKAAVIGMTRSLALECARDNIRVNCIAPGLVKTEMADELTTMVGPEQYAAIVASHPLGLGKAADVATAAAFLLADASRWITGTTLVVDGGYTAR